MSILVSTHTVAVNRHELLRAVKRARQAVPARCYKPILTCVHLQARDGLLHVRATDCELAVFAQAPAEGTLPTCVVPCDELLQRLKASRSDSCGLILSGEDLILTGGRVKHALHTLDAAEFPPVVSRYAGDAIEVDASELCHALQIAGVAAAREATRYAINGVQLESDDKGTRLVATDGRRLVTIELQSAGSEFAGQAIMPRRMTRLIEKFTAKATDFLVLAVQRNERKNGEGSNDGEVQPAKLYAAGPDWLLSTQECEGRFPNYREVLPARASQFAIDRTAFIEALSEVAVATGQDHHAVRLDLSADEVQFSAGTSEIGKSFASIPAEFLGGQDAIIHTGFNPAFLLDALKTLPGDVVVLDVAQNSPAGGQVSGKPALLYARHEPSVRWVVMPVNVGLEATPENLGSNYEQGEAA